VVDKLAGAGRVAFATTLPQGHPQRDQDQVGALGRGGVQGHDPLAKQSTMNAT